jgi:polar amino acid transport system substrate-binding protein
VIWVWRQVSKERHIFKAYIRFSKALLRISVMAVVLSLLTAPLPFALCPTVKAAEKVAITAFNYPPYMDEALPGNGLFCELAYEAYRSAGVDVSFKFFPLKRSTEYVKRGQELAQLGTVWNFPEASRKDLQPVPMFYYRVVGFYLKDRFEEIHFKRLKDLRGYRLGVIAGSSDEAILKKDKRLKIEAVSSMAQMFQKLYLANRQDIVFAVELSGLSFIRKQYPGDMDRWVMTQDAVQGLRGDIVFSKKYPDAAKYIAKFKAGFGIIRENGTYQRVFEKYYGKGKVPPIVNEINREIFVLPKE